MAEQGTLLPSGSLGTATLFTPYLLLAPGPPPFTVGALRAWEQEQVCPGVLWLLSYLVFSLAT